MRKILAVLLSLAMINVADASSVFYGQCTLKENYDISNRPHGKGWYGTIKGTEIDMLDNYDNWAFIEYNRYSKGGPTDGPSDNYQGWIPFEFLQCNAGIWAKIAYENYMKK